MEPRPDFRYSVYETSASLPAKQPDRKFLAAVKRLLCFGRSRRTGGLGSSMRLDSSVSRMNLALAVAEQYVLVSWDNPLDETDQATVTNTPATMQSSPMSGTSDRTLHCDTAQLGSGKMSTGCRRRSLAISSLLPRSLRLHTRQSSATASPASYRPSTICEHGHHRSESHLYGCRASPAMVAARENPLFC